ncbi:hypothetical protein MM440_05070 [Arsenicicoccus piscis]|uniref:four-carbon acid sugar kinase family protein n=1 Tax=Arsenicicoccus piscis TaxID=673954 RepID=UPI001F4CB27E|nr:four-carbon acid sugar kinase family protein [Arsenicicoccus piscis]MCH8627171.1 hypothetical protein [Arsenicicoccus piscis]
MTTVLGIMADDLSGASESVAALGMRETRTQIRLGAGASHGPATEVVCVDTDSRGLRPAAAAAVREAAEALGDVPVLVKKCDSLLRGNLAVEAVAVGRLLDRPILVAPSLPALGRTVRGGVPYVGELRLGETDLWSGESTTPPASVADLFEHECVVVDPHAADAAGRLRTAWQSGAVAIGDAASGDDLRRLATIALSVDEQPLLVGSAALVAAVGDSVLPNQAPAQQHPLPQASSLLYVIGSSSRAARAQIEQLRPRADRIIHLDPTELLRTAALHGDRAPIDPAVGVTVVQLDPAAEVIPSQSPLIARALASAVQMAAAEADALFLSGGETARRVLDLIGVTTLEPVGQIGHGTAVSVDPDTGRIVITRPGSFGSLTNLVEVLDAVRPSKESHV